MRRKERGPRGTPPPGPLRGGKGIAGSQMRGPHGRLSSALPRGGGEQGDGGIGAVGRGLGFVWLILAFRGGASARRAQCQWRAPDFFPSSLEAASRQRVVRVEGPQLEGAHAALRLPLHPREYLYARRAKGGGQCAGEGRGPGRGGRGGQAVGEEGRGGEAYLLMYMAAQLWLCVL